jgi:hypothetical protein
MGVQGQGSIGRAQPEQSRSTGSLGAAGTWTFLAVGVLLLAGLLALLLVIGRMPPFSNWITDAHLFRRILVVHVDLSLGVWLYAFVAGIACLLPTKRALGSAVLGSRIAILGTVCIVAAGGMPGAEPVLSNYIPMIDHPLFVIGVVVFALGVMVTVADPRRMFARDAWREGTAEEERQFPIAARVGIRAAGIAFFLAVVTFAVSAVMTPRELVAASYYEFLVWGGGHVLQFASVAAMLTVWVVLLSRALGRPVMGKRAAIVLFSILVVPLLGAPFLAAQGTTTVTYYDGFTQYMRWGIFPVVTCVLFLCVRALWRARKRGRMPERGLLDPGIAGFLASATLTFLGVGLGFMIRGSNTVVPGHYHAAIGGVTVSFMAMTYLLMQRMNVQLRSPRLRRARSWQPYLFAGGQAVFAIGFAIAGMHGAGRKVYGQEQHIRSALEYLGLGVMGLGGLVAVLGGVLFLTIAVSAWLSGAARLRRTSWSTNQRNIPSKS